MAKVRVGPAARRDLDRQALWFLTKAGPDVAVRFAEAATSTFAKLSESPELGSPLTSRNPVLGGLRKWRVDRFPNQLIFYQPLSDGIRIVRALHAAQDWAAALDLG